MRPAPRTTVESTRPSILAALAKARHPPIVDPPKRIAHDVCPRVGGRDATPVIELGSRARRVLWVQRVRCECPSRVLTSDEPPVVSESLQSDGHRRTAIADQSADDLVTEIEIDERTLRGHLPEALGGIAEQRDDAILNAGQVQHRQMHGCPMCLPRDTVEQDIRHAGPASCCLAKTRAERSEGHRAVRPGIG